MVQIAPYRPGDNVTVRVLVGRDPIDGPEYEWEDGIVERCFSSRPDHWIVEVKVPWEDTPEGYLFARLYCQNGGYGRDVRPLRAAS